VTLGWPAPPAARLEGDLVVVEPLAAEHGPDLRAAAADPEIWRWVAPGTEDDFDPYLAAALGGAADEQPFAVLDRRSGRAVGATRYLAMRPEDRGLEIGSTWYARSAWRTGINVETKLLLLTHAFETLGCLRVELKTHASNERSRAAILALGAQFEGIFRKHKVLPGLGVRDTAWYAIVDDDWPAVKARLQSRLAAHASGSSN
jgi:RimJ/RimL family protein N-acetyltransferase